ncbi:MAG: DUF1552 domain-containing protein [Myxococcales bacterium]|nr:DUF1552 domain-containing protein [Myxococcales bacterium]
MWNHTNIDRRSLLQSLGMGGAAYLLPSLRGKTAQAAEKPPQRVVIFYTFHGWYFPECLPVGPDGKPESATETNYKMGATHTPLEPWKSKIIMPNGVDLVGGGSGEAHGKGETVALTGLGKTVGTLPGSISVDQHIAKKLNEPKPTTLLTSLDLRVVSLARGYSNPGTGNQSAASTIAAGKPTPLESDPRKAFMRLFPNGPMNPNNMGTDQLAAYRKQKRSVLDFVHKQFEGAKSKVSKDDWDKLDSHASLVRALELKLDTNAGPIGAGCADLSNTNLSDTAQLGDGAKFRTLCDQQFSVIQAGFACDLSRVAMLSVSFPPGDAFGYKPGDFGIEHEHQFVHSHENHSGKGQSAEVLLKGYRVYAEVFAKLLEKLDAVKESDGTSLLDNTAVLWCGQIAKGLHSLKGGRWLIAGSLGGKLKTGRYLKDTTITKNGDMFSTITDAMGLGTFNGSPVSQLRA